MLELWETWPLEEPTKQKKKETQSRGSVNVAVGNLKLLSQSKRILTRP